MVEGGLHHISTVASTVACCQGFYQQYIQVSISLIVENTYLWKPRIFYLCLQHINHQKSKIYLNFKLILTEFNGFILSKGMTIVCSDCLDTISYRPIEAGEKMSIYFKQAYFGVIFMLWFFSNWWKKVTTFSHL